MNILAAYAIEKPKVLRINILNWLTNPVDESDVRRHVQIFEQGEQETVKK